MEARPQPNGMFPMNTTLLIKTEEGRILQSPPRTSEVPPPFPPSQWELGNRHLCVLFLLLGLVQLEGTLGLMQVSKGNSVGSVGNQ